MHTIEIVFLNDVRIVTCDGNLSVVGGKFRRVF